MKRINIRRIKKHFNYDKKVYILPIICLIIGTILGTASSLVLNSETAQPVTEYLNNFFSAYTLQGVDKNEVFKVSLYNNIKMLIILWISGLSVFLIPFLALYVGVKGFKIGFAISFLIKSFSYSGALLSVTSMLTQAFIIVPFIIIYSGYNISLAPKMRLMREKKLSNDEKKSVFLSNLIAVSSSVVVLILASYIDCFVVPLISSSICMSLV